MLMLCKPKLILDIGTNYYEVAQMMDMTPFGAAKYMIQQAARAGATAVKFQWYKADKIVRPGTPAYWPTDENQYQVFSRQDSFGLNEYQKLKDYCDYQNVEFMASAFDADSLIQLDPLVKRHKIASCEITNLPYLELVEKTGKPVIISIGASKPHEIKRAVSIFQRYSLRELVLMHCVLSYPTPAFSAGLNVISKLRSDTIDPDVNEFARYINSGHYHYAEVGYSDHCVFDKEILLTAWLLGARIIEKHFTVEIEKKGRPKGNDHFHAMDVRQANEFWDTVFRIQDAFDYTADQTQARNLARRGVYLTRNVRKNRRVRWEDVECLRPQNAGVSPLGFQDMINLKAKYPRNMKKGEQIFYG